MAARTRAASGRQAAHPCVGLLSRAAPPQRPRRSCRRGCYTDAGLKQLFLSLAVVAGGAAQAWAASVAVNPVRPVPVSLPVLGSAGLMPSGGLVAPGGPSPSLMTPSLLPALSPAVPVLPAAPGLAAVQAAAPEAASAEAQAPAAALPSLQALAERTRTAEQGEDAAALGEFYDRRSDGQGAAGVPLGEPASAGGDFAGRFRVPYAPKGRVDLSRLDPGRTPGMNRQKEKAKDRLSEDQEELDALQQRLYAEGKRSVLIVLQAMDTGGKDGTIRWVLAGLNPQGVKVTGFKKPTPQEARHGFLWRIRKALPGKGIIGVFNRSHYEDILAPTVHKTFPAREVEGRYDEINAFERKLAGRGVTILKFFLHISKDEQKERLQERLDDPDKRWKFSPADLETRKRWDDFQDAYGKVLARTSTPWAPWHIIPSNKKWYRNYAVARIIREALERMDPRFPRPAFDPSKIVISD